MQLASMVRCDVRKREYASPTWNPHCPLPGWLDGSNTSPLLRRSLSFPNGKIRPPMSERFPGRAFQQAQLGVDHQIGDPRWIGRTGFNVAAVGALGIDEIDAVVISKRPAKLKIVG